MTNRSKKALEDVLADDEKTVGDTNPLGSTINRLLAYSIGAIMARGPNSVQRDAKDSMKSLSDDIDFDTLYRPMR